MSFKQHSTTHKSFFNNNQDFLNLDNIHVNHNFWSFPENVTNNSVSYLISNNLKEKLSNLDQKLDSFLDRWQGQNGSQDNSLGATPDPTTGYYVGDTTPTVIPGAIASKRVQFFLETDTYTATGYYRGSAYYQMGDQQTTFTNSYDYWRTNHSGSGLMGTTYNDYLTAKEIHGRDGGNDVIYGNTSQRVDISGYYVTLPGAADTLLGLGGNDTLYGRDGNDTIYGDYSNTSLATGGNDSLDGGTGNDTLHGGSGNDILRGGTGQDKVYGDSGDDLFYIDVPTSSSYGDQAYGGSDVDTFYIGGTTTTSTTTNTSNPYDWGGIALNTADQVAATTLGKPYKLIKYTVTGIVDLFKGLQPADTNTQTVTNTPANLAEGQQIQIEDFNPTEDVLVIPVNGTLSNVSYEINNGELNLFYDNSGQTFAQVALDDFSTIFNNSTLGTSSGVSNQIWQSVTRSALLLDSQANLASLGINGADVQIPLTDSEIGGNFTVNELDASYIVIGAYGGSQQLGAVNGTNFLYGTNYGDTLISYATTEIGATTDVRDSLNSDQLYGFGGNDTLAGGGGDDFLFGGTGFDIADYSSEGDANGDGFGIVVNLSKLETNTGAAYIDPNSGQKYATGTDGYGTQDQLYGIEGVYGSQFADSITGDGQANLFVGNEGIDTLNGGAGNDTLNGGAGDDILVGSAGEDVADYSFDDLLGSFKMTSSADPTTDYTVTTQSGIDVLTGIESVRFATDNAAWTLTSDEATNNLQKIYAGNALGTINGTSGNDFLIGGTMGLQTLVGGDGDDILFSGANQAHSFNGGAGADIFVANNSITDYAYTFQSGVDKILIDASAYGISDTNNAQVTTSINSTYGWLDIYLNGNIMMTLADKTDTSVFNAQTDVAFF